MLAGHTEHKRHDNHALVGSQSQPIPYSVVIVGYSICNAWRVVVMVVAIVIVSPECMRAKQRCPSMVAREMNDSAISFLPPRSRPPFSLVSNS